MLKLYYGPGTCSLVAHIALRLTGEMFELQRVNLAEGEQVTDKYRETVNAHGRVPVLDLGDGRKLTESTVIASYIAETFPSAGLVPVDRFQAFRGREMISWANTTMHAETYATIFRPHRFSDDETVQAALKSYGKLKLLDLLNFADERIASRDWGEPEQITLTDLFLYVYGRWAGRIGISLVGYPAYTGLLEWIESLPATQAALEVEGLK